MRHFRFALLLIPATLIPLYAFASGGAEHESGRGMLWFNFCVYLVILVLALRKPFSSLWPARSAEIGSFMARAADELKSADAQLISNRDKLVAVDREIAQMRDEMQRETVKELASIREAAEFRKKLIAGKALDLCRIEEKSVVNGVKAEIVASALESVARELSDRFSPEKDRVLRNAALNKVSGLLQ